MAPRPPLPPQAALLPDAPSLGDPHRRPNPWRPSLPTSESRSPAGRRRRWPRLLRPRRCGAWSGRCSWPRTAWGASWSTTATTSTGASRRTSSTTPTTCCSDSSPRLAIRNTCPLCRHELPTDDPEYEKWKARLVASGGDAADADLRGAATGGHFGAVKYAVTFAAAGTTLDYAALRLAPQWHALKEHFSGKKDLFTLPEWSPIQVLDEEALAKKKAREEKLFAQRALSKLNKEEP